jgi:hypothetical protein
MILLRDSEIRRFERLKGYHLAITKASQSTEIGGCRIFEFSEHIPDTFRRRRHRTEL